MIHHGDTEARTKLLHESLTEQIIGAAIEVSSSAGSRTSRVRLRGMSLPRISSPRNLIRATKAVGG